MPEKKLKMCPDPECSKESPEEAEACIGCGIDFAAFNSFDRILSVRERRKEADEKKSKKPETKKKSLLDSLRGPK